MTLPMDRPGEKLIHLNRGYAVRVSEQDYDDLARHRWSAQIDRTGTVYARRNEKRDGRWVKVYMHRAITRCPRGLLVDHRDGDGLNNTRRNLRIATRSDNSCNIIRPNAAEFRGVERHGRKFRARITVGGVREELGVFDTPHDAARAYDARAYELYGEFAWLNFASDLIAELGELVDQDIPF